jgi:hypothetical protein
MLETYVGRGDLVDKARADQKIGGQRRGRTGEKAADATPAPDQLPHQLHWIVVHMHTADGEETGTLWHQSLDRLGRAEEHDPYRPLDTPAAAPAGTF